jgi:hypothetical protein
LSSLAIHATALVATAPSRLRWIGLFLVNSALIQTHYLFGAVWVGQLLWLLRAAGNGKVTVRQIGLWLLSLAACLLTIAPGVMRVWLYRDYLNWTTQRPSTGDLMALAMPVQLPWLAKPLGIAMLALPLVWHVAAGRYRPNEWFDRERWQANRSFIGWCVIWLAVPTAGLWLIGRFWLASLAADRYVSVFIPASALIWAGLCTMLKGRVAPIVALLVLLVGGGTVERTYRVLDVMAKGQDEPDPQAAGISISARWEAVAKTIDQKCTERDLVLVGSGLTEMRLIPILLDDPILHDYVACRLGRMYLPTAVRRKSIPMHWPAEGSSLDVSKYYRAEIARTCHGGYGPSSASKPKIWVVSATDTDVLSATSRRTQALLESVGATEVWRGGYVGLDVVQYECRLNP